MTVQVLIAYGLDRGLEDSVVGRLERVASHYRQLWQVPVTRRGRDVGSAGLHIWDATDSPWRWPSWQEDEALAVATLDRPIGYERVLGAIPPERAVLGVLLSGTVTLRRRNS